MPRVKFMGGLNFFADFSQKPEMAIKWLKMIQITSNLCSSWILVNSNYCPNLKSFGPFLTILWTFPVFADVSKKF